MAGRMTYQVSAEPGLERASIPSQLVRPAAGGRVTVRAERWIPAAVREAVAG